MPELIPCRCGHVEDEHTGCDGLEGGCPNGCGCSYYEADVAPAPPAAPVFVAGIPEDWQAAALAYWSPPIGATT